MMNFDGVQDLGGASAQNETQAPEEKVVSLEEQKKKRQPFAYWNVGSRSFKMKLKASGIGRLKRHYDASRKNCPRRIQAEGRWSEFVKKTAAYMKGQKTVNNTTGTTKSTTTLTDKIEIQLPVIRKGSKGTAVSMLQAMLGVSADGDFGNDTEASLKAFQKNVKLSADGICGTDSWKKVIEHMKANTK